MPVKLPREDQSVAGGPQNQRVSVHAESDIGSARRAAARLAAEVGLDETQTGALALVVTEAATNIARHGRDGMVLLREVTSNGCVAVEMLAVDKGNGIHDMPRAMGDGYSTGGTRGQGLGAIKRNSTSFDIWSSPGRGTAVVARFSSSSTFADVPARAGVVCTAIQGESLCGDAWAIEETGSGSIVTIADGLGHGPDAALASGTAIRVIRDRRAKPIPDIFTTTHGALRATRGAAIQIVSIERATVRSVGVGNIAASVSTSSTSKSLPSQPGIVGHKQPTLREVSIDWPDGGLLVMHSDGVSARWRLDDYPGLRLRDPALIAGVLYRDFARERDDATIIVTRGVRVGS